VAFGSLGLAVMAGTIVGYGVIGGASGSSGDGLGVGGEVVGQQAERRQSR
jgi:hypothetical protein